MLERDIQYPRWNVTLALMLAANTYVPNWAKQSAALVPAIVYSAAFVIMLFYPLSDHYFLELVQGIKARR